MRGHLTASDMHFYHYPEIQTLRPYAFDVDENSVLWEGANEAVYRLDTRSGAHEKIALPSLKGHSACSVWTFQGKVYLLLERCDYVTVYDPLNRTEELLALPGNEPTVWYGLKAAGKLLLFDRSKDGGILILDHPGAPLRKVTNPFGDIEIAGGRLMANGRIAISKPDYGGFLFFDPERETFLETLDADPGTSLLEQTWYVSDGINGRLLPYSVREDRWLDPIPTPDHGKVYGFIGGCFDFGNSTYYCLSTYRFRSQINRETGELILPEGWDIGVDGRRPNRFLDRFLVYDAAGEGFEYLIAPQFENRTVLLCYSQVQGDRIYITGYLIPHGADGGPSDQPGDWVVWTNVEMPGNSF